MSYHTEKDNGNGGCGCLAFIVLTMFLLGGVFIYGGKSTAKSKPQKEIVVEDASSLTSYIEAAEKLELDYKIQNSGDKKKKIIIYLPAE